MAPKQGSSKSATGSVMRQRAALQARLVREGRASYWMPYRDVDAAWAKAGLP